MNETAFNIMMLVCAVAVLALIFAKPLKLVFKLLINSVIGIFALVGMNFLLSPLGLAVGINAVTVLVCAVLGIPGFACLYICQLIL